MKTVIRFSPILLLAFFILQFTACDTCEELREFVRYEPVYIDQAEYERPVSMEAPREVENAGVIASYGNYLFVNDYNAGIHIINNSDPANPVNQGFIAINNNKHFSIQNGIVLANRYHDLVAVDIRDANNIQEVKRVENVFPDESVITDEGIISHYDRTSEIEKRDCEDPFRGDWWWDGDIIMMDSRVFTSSVLSSAEANNLQGVGSGTSTSSSTTRFTISNNHLYVLNAFTLEIFNIENASDPLRINTTNVDFGSETLFPLNDYLFIGAQQGMSIYDISNPSSPQFVSNFSHAFACDPVVANETHAFVTLRSGTVCQGFTNQMDVIDIDEIEFPQLVSSHPLNNPRGLAIVGDHVFVCDGDAGIAIFDIEDAENTHRVSEYEDKHANDILPVSNSIVVISGESGIYQLDVSDRLSPELLSVVTSK